MAGHSVVGGSQTTGELAVKYRVSWDPDAFRRLVREWVAANEPDSGIRAFDTIEDLLSTDADSQGEPRHDNRRILIVPPLGVIFRAKTRGSQPCGDSLRRKRI
jgi:hypothetical protein